jgi:hypothetical protein
VLRLSPKINERSGGREATVGCSAVAVPLETNVSILALSQNDYMHHYFGRAAQSSLVSYFCDGKA